MDRFSWTLRHKAAALSVFQKAKDKLAKVIEQMEMHHNTAAANIAKKNDQISEETNAMLFAAGEIDQAKKVIAKIDAILN